MAILLKILGDQLAESSRRLVIVLPHLGVGGAQRVAVCLAGYWAERGHEITIVTTIEGKDDFYPLPHDIKRIRVEKPTHPGWLTGWLNTRYITSGGSVFWYVPMVMANIARIILRRTKNAFRSLLRQLIGAVARLFTPGQALCAMLVRLHAWRVVPLRRILSDLKPDVVLSLLGATNIITVAASRGLGHRVVISERNDPAKQRLQTPWEELRPLLYPAADIISANSMGAVESMRAYCAEEKLVYAPNPLMFAENADHSDRLDAILFLGRLVHQKAPDILIEAFARFIESKPNWTLQLAGEGPMREQLQGRVMELGLDAHVTFHGLVSDPTPLLKSSEIFVLPSRFEGTPNALLEAMALRTSCIVSDASPGPLKLIDEGISGLVVKTGCADSLAAAMDRLARSEDLRRKFGKAGVERVQEFRLERVAKVWEQVLFEETASVRQVHQAESAALPGDIPANNEDAATIVTK